MEWIIAWWGRVGAEDEGAFVRAGLHTRGVMLVAVAR